MREELHINIFTKFAAAFSLPIIAFLFKQSNLSALSIYYGFFTDGAMTMIEKAINLKFVIDHPYTPIFLVWTVFGVLAYLFYYLTCFAYYKIVNLVILKTNYTNTETLNTEINITTLKRVSIHTIVIVYFLFIGLITYYFSFPLSELFRAYTENVLLLFTTGKMAFLLSFTILVMPWYLMFTIFTILFEKIANLVINTDINSEHETEKLKLATLLRPSKW